MQGGPAFGKGDAYVQRTRRRLIECSFGALMVVVPLPKLWLEVSLHNAQIKGLTVRDRMMERSIDFTSPWRRHSSIATEYGKLFN